MFTMIVAPLVDTADKIYTIFCLVRFHSLVLVSESFSCNTFVHDLKLHTVQSANLATSPTPMAFEIY
jgi:hypothetical protein